MKLKIFNRINGGPRTEKRGFLENVLTSLGLNYGFGSTATAFNVDAAMKLSAVYRCVEVISDAIATLPVEVMRLTDNRGWSVDQKHEHVNMLNLEPNPSMSSFSFMKAMIARMLLDGNGYAEVLRDKRNNAVGLDLIIDAVSVYRMKNGLLYYKIQPINRKAGDKERIIEQSNIIHLLNFSYNGLIGVSTLSYASDTLSLTQSSEKTAKGFFNSGANLSGILAVTGKINPVKAQEMKAAWATAFNQDTGTPGGVAVIEGGTTFTPSQVNPKDGQMLESRAFNIIDICRFFGVSPTKVFDLTNSAYSNVESMQLSFLTDTINPLVVKIENEFNRKLFRPSERSSLKVRYDISEILRADLTTQANWYRKMVDIGCYSPNEVRSKIGNPAVEGGDTSYIQVNLKPLELKPKENEKGS